MPGTNENGARSAVLFLAIAGCLWGTGFLFGKIAFREMSVTENVTFRFVCGSVALLPFLLKSWKPFRGRELWMLMIISVVGVPVQFLIQFTGLQFTTVSHASLIVGTLPILLALGSTIFLSERLTRTEWGILFASSFGTLLIALPTKDSISGPQPSTKGDLLVLISMLAAVAVILVTKRLVDTHDSLQVTAAMIVVGTLFLLAWAAFRQPLRFRFSPSVWAAVAAQGLLATAGAYLFWNWGLARVAASRSGVFLNLEPIVGTILGLLILHERLRLTAAFGAGLTIASAIYFSRRPAA
jgi:drug/metabolite transporter (DMT)-like permease